MSDNQNKQKPVAKIRCFPVQAAIWKNETAKGTFHTVTFSRTYKKENGEYGDTDSFSGAQLLQLAHVAQKAYDKAEKLTREARAAEADEEDDSDVTDYADTSTELDDDIAF
ncbi:MAG: hypothetical protein WC807_16515 [Hyphomicrobium sp.]|jgi:hypothetical protein